MRTTCEKASFRFLAVSHVVWHVLSYVVSHVASFAVRFALSRIGLACYLNSVRTAIYAGSFDPITRGHEDLVMRSLEFVDRLVVAVATNVAKQPLFSADERVKLIRAALNDESRIDVRQFSGLLVDFAREAGARLLIRGLRAVSDFEYEYQMALMNRHLSPGLETVFMVPSLDTTYISASLVREVARFGGEVSDLVHPAVAAALHAKYPSKPKHG
jgi:pantetheine-phosphate adenylyltransferase